MRSELVVFVQSAAPQASSFEGHCQISTPLESSDLAFAKSPRMGLVLDEINFDSAAASDKRDLCNQNIPGSVEPTKIVARLIKAISNAAHGLGYLRDPPARARFDRLTRIDELFARMHAGEEVLRLVVVPAIFVCPPHKLHVLLRHRPLSIPETGWR